MQVFKHNNGGVRSARDGELNRLMVNLAQVSYEGVFEKFLKTQKSSKPKHFN